MVVTALCMAVWWCLMAPRAIRALLVVLSSPLAVLSLCGCCALFTVWFPLPLGDCAFGLRCLRRKLAAKLVQSRLPFVVRAPSVVSRLGFFLWRLFRLGLEGCGPVLVPPFFFFGGGGGALLPLSWLFSLGGSNSLVVQAP